MGKNGLPAGAEAAQMGVLAGQGRGEVCKRGGAWGGDEEKTWEMAKFWREISLTAEEKCAMMVHGVIA